MAFGKSAVNNLVDSVVNGEKTSEDAKKEILNAINAEKKAAAEKAVKDYIKSQEEQVKPQEEDEVSEEDKAKEVGQAVSEIEEMYKLLDGHVLYTCVEGANGEKAFVVVVSKETDEEILDALLENYTIQTFGAEFDMTTETLAKRYTYLEMSEEEMDMLDTAICEAFLDLPIYNGTTRFTSTDFPNSVIHLWTDMADKPAELANKLIKEKKEKSCGSGCACSRNSLADAVMLALLRSYFG